MRRWRSITAGLLLLTLVAAACGSDDGGGGGETGGGETGGSGETVRVGMALPGPKNDKGFNQAHYQGMLDAQEQLGVEITVVENVVDPQARIDALKNLAADNDLVIAVGGEYAEAGSTVAPQFPDVQFAGINGEQTDAENLHIYFVRQGLPAYVAGVLAAQLTTSGKVGYVGGELIPPTTQSDDAMKAAVEATDPDVEYATTIVGNFNDAEKAKEAAAAQIAAGADVIYGLLDAGFPGVQQAVEESGKDVLTMSAIFSRCEEGANIVGTTYLNSAAMVVAIIQEYMDGTMPAGEPQFFGLEDPEIQAAFAVVWATRTCRGPSTT
ncbi:MAG: BMP family protein [Actinomycetota bacterium]